MLLVRVESLDDPRVIAYRNLPDRDLAREGGRFIAEGQTVVCRMLQSRTHPVESLLVADERLGRVVPVLEERLGPDTPVYVCPMSVLQAIVGFKFHSGVLAVGIRPVCPTLEAVVRREGVCRLLICPQIEKTDNLGSLIRLAAGLGVDAMILGQHCCDPYYRQSVRVSMGSVFHLPIVRSCDLLADLRALRADFGVRLLASVLDPAATPLDRFTPPTRWGLLVGNEAQGLDEPSQALCDERLTIPMDRSTDSLNVATATGIFLWALGRSGLART